MIKHLDHVTCGTLCAVRVTAQPVDGRPLLGLGVEAEPPPFPFRNPASLSAAACDAIQARAERRLRLLRPAVVRIFCFAEQWNPSLDGETFTWEHPDYLRLVRMLGVVRDLGGRANLVLFSHSHEPLPVLCRLVRAMVAMLAHLRGAHGFDHVAWLTLFNEPESVFRQDTPLARAIFTSSPVPHTWDEYVALNRLAMGLLQTAGLAGVRMVMPDSAWGGRMRRERMELTAAAFPHDDICFGYHHYNPEDPDFNDHAPPEFAYYGVREEAERFRRLVGPCRQLVVWEFNNAGDAFNTHFPGTDKRGRNVLESPEAGAELAYRVITALQYGADGLCLWHMHDSDVNKFGLWRWEDEGSTMRGYWHTYALLCHSFRPGWRVLPVSQPPETVSVLAACDAAGAGVRVAVQNRTGVAAALALDLAVGGGRATLRRLDPQTLPPPEREEPFYAESEETVDADGRVRLSLKPWELVVVEIGEPEKVNSEWDTTGFRGYRGEGCRVG